MSKMAELHAEEQERKVGELGYRIMVTICQYMGSDTLATMDELLLVGDTLLTVTAFFDAQREELIKERERLQ